MTEGPGDNLHAQTHEEGLVCENGPGKIPFAIYFRYLSSGGKYAKLNHITGLTLKGLAISNVVK